MHKIYLEIPFDSTDARRRNINTSLCKLIIKCEPSTKTAEVAKIISGFNSKRNLTVICAINEFKPLGELSGCERINIGDDVAVTAQDVATLSRVLASWDSEAYAIFFADDASLRQILTNKSKLKPRWWQLSKGGYESPFLSQIDLAGAFIFYERSSESLEVIGKKDSILSYFDWLRTALDDLKSSR